MWINGGKGLADKRCGRGIRNKCGWGMGGDGWRSKLVVLKRITLSNRFEPK